MFRRFTLMDLLVFVDFNSDNNLIREKLDWDYTMTLEEGIASTYAWIDEQLKEKLAQS